MLKRKKIMASILASCVALTTVLAGCSKPQETASNTNTGSGEKVTLKFLHRWPMEPNKSFMDKVVANYEKANPNIKIDMQSVANDPYKEKIKVVLGTNDAPDVFFSWSGEFMYKFARENKMLDLTSELSKDGWRDSLMESQLKPFELNGKTYELPFRVDAKVSFYNTKVFQDAGVSVPNTWDEFIKVCETLKSKGITPISYGNQAPWASSHYMGTLNQKMVAEDVRTKDYAAATGEFTDPGYVAAFKKYQQLIPFFNANPNAITHQQARQNWMNGKAAMIYVETAEIGEIQKAQPADLKWDMFKFPVIPDGKGDQNKLTGAPEGFVVSANTKHPKEAIDFVKYLCGKEVGLQEVKDTGIINGMKGLYNSSNADPMVVKAANLINEAKDIVYWLDTDLNSKLVDAYLSETQKLTNKDTTPEKFMEKIKQVAQEVKAGAK